MQFTYIGSQSKKDVRVASSIANGAFVTANSASSFANGAFGAANSAGTYANSAFSKANNTLSLTGGIIAGNVTANSFIANTSVYSPIFYSPSGTTNLTLSDIGIVAINSGGQEIKFGASGIESSKGIYGGSYGGNRLSLDNETRLISNRYDIVKIATGTDGTDYSTWLFSNNQLIFPDNTYQNTAFQGVAIDQTSRNTANSASLYANGAFDAANSASNYANGAFTTANLKFNTSGGTISGDVSITGNLSVLGNTFSTSATQIVANDTMFIMGTGNYTGDILDIGFASHYNNGTNAHTGLIRDAGTKEWQLFEEYTPEVGADNNININDASFKIATLNANLKSTTITVKGIDLLPYVNNAYATANSGALYANGAFTAANTSDDKATSASLYANGAFGAANSISSYANAAFNAANSASLYANAAFAAANSGSSSSFAFDQANAAFAQANAAFAAANTGGGGGSNSTISILTNKFVANGSTSTFNLSVSPLSEDFVTAVVDGIVQLRDTYTITGNVIYFDTTFENGANVEVTTLSGNSYVSGASSDTYARDTANAAFIQANAAFTQANTGGTSLSKAIAMSIVFGF